MAETYQATHDAVQRIVARAISKRPPRFATPWYLEAETSGVSRGLTPETGLDEAIMSFGRRTRGEPAVGPDGSIVIGRAA